ncbi:MAG: Xaa-Pro peptidase family protein [Acidobacteriota bacterium]|jgi:Xaa-Pro dipeptidase
MRTRREFLTLSAAAVAAASMPGRVESDAPDLPPALAALEPMADRAVPITVEERRERIERARRLMAANRIDCLLLAGGTSLTYFTGASWGNSERLFAVVLPRKRRPFVVTPAFEEERAREQMALGPLAEKTEVLTWEEDEDPYLLVAKALRDRGAASETLGVEETVPFVFSDGVAKAAPALRLTSGTPVTAGCRGRKDAHELELMRLASAATLRAFAATYASLAEGMTAEDVKGLIRDAHARLGFSGGALVLVGEDTALPHGTVRPQVVREGTIVLIDGGCRAEGYASDISRTFVLGKPSEKMRRVFEVEVRAQAAALAAARPGAQAQAVDAAARKVIADAGYGPGYRHFTHRVGHGIGMDGHEWPYLVKGNTLELQPGMTFSDEPGIYLPGEFGVRLEDEMVITEAGSELLTPPCLSLEEPFAAA